MGISEGRFISMEEGCDMGIAEIVFIRSGGSVGWYVGGIISWVESFVASGGVAAADG